MSHGMEGRDRPPPAAADAIVSWEHERRLATEMPAYRRRRKPAAKEEALAHRRGQGAGSATLLGAA